MSMAIEPDSAGVRFHPPLVYLGALLLGLAAEQFVSLRSFGVDWRLLAATGALLFVAGAAVMLAATWLFRRLRTNVRPSEPTTLIARTGPYRWTRNPMYLGMAFMYAGLAIGFDGPIAFALLPLALIAIQTRVIAREERYLEAKFGDDYRRYKALVHRWLTIPPLPTARPRNQHARQDGSQRFSSDHS
jgi:protein-S-isoprenylcysteine O-methyltransferase Ste14